MGDIHRTARAFGEVPAEYEHGRPGYASQAVEHVVRAARLGTHSVVLDLGAGTGKLARMLAAAGPRVIAIEPLPAMLEQLRAAAPQVQALAGTAESIPVAGASVDAVTAGQAFHWFEAPAALQEIHRVLRPEGALALLWNVGDPADPVHALLAELTDPPERRSPRGWKLDVPVIVASSGGFGPVVTCEFPHVQPIDDAGLLSRLRSSSFVAALPAARRAGLERRLEEGLRRLGPVRGLAYTTVVHLAFSLPS